LETLKILIFNWRCWLNPAMGGAEVFTHEVAKRWSDNGHDVTLFTSEFPKCKKEETLDGIHVVRSGGRFSVYLQAIKYYKKISTPGHDVVLDEVNTMPFFAPKFVDPKTKVVALIHQLAREYWHYETPFPVNYFGYYCLENSCLRSYVNVPTLTVSESSRSDLVSLGFRKVFVVSEGLNFEPLDAMPKKSAFPLVVYSGRLRKAKRPDHAINAFKEVKARIPEAQLWIIGNGPFLPDLKKIAGAGVKFFGNIDNDQRRKINAQAWVLLNQVLEKAGD
jgi:glycosyltransferase involved in cell wall biosynthesis